ncbi:MAG: 3-oxoacid CoA-transferase subunit B [Tepidibacter sp.]|jgi:3-oxoacid CoA-transferase subunit B/acetate CoA/acetoacetate CoA-transferase beta subunit|uniref:3-oxoacid CoA-transferase subunit B n=1 Tax=Tepidibacter sp. TaxID=2529387 RepID=UPI0025CC2527|nr:3-oxoacid CoA-transferase subunit B [Tepidibacter sp.]MCT4507892.1 3-oxoacid CoA-transferase subunit B [Tepidibacter sp.]
MNPKKRIAKRAAKEFKDGMVVNLGFGIPVLASNYIPEEVNVTLQSENGILNFGEVAKLGEEDNTFCNAAGMPVTPLIGCSLFNLDTSFAIIRGGHVDITILGALEVDQNGNIANWALKNKDGKYSPGMGGAMDLLVGAKKVIATTLHTTKNGESKILKECKLPLSAKGVVDLIITELAVIQVTKEGLVLKELAPEVTADEVIKKTDADLIIPDEIGIME